MDLEHFGSPEFLLSIIYNLEKTFNASQASCLFQPFQPDNMNIKVR